MTEDVDIALRICTRTTTNPFAFMDDKAITTGDCSRCGWRVWVDSAQRMPFNFPVTIQLVCTECAQDDPEVGPTLYRNLVSAYLKKEVLGQTHTWRVGE